MQDPDPIPWGAMDRFQAHYIVRADPSPSAIPNYVARTRLATRGRFGSKAVERVEWIGSGSLAARLNGDDALNEMIARRSVKEATIYVEPTEGAVRIRTKWDNHLAFGITREMYEIYDRIAGHIRSV